MVAFLSHSYLFVCLSTCRVVLVECSRDSSSTQCSEQKWSQEQMILTVPLLEYHNRAFKGSQKPCAKETFAFSLWGFTCSLDRGNFFSCSSKSQHLLSVYYVLGNVGNNPAKSAALSPFHRWENRVGEIPWHLWKSPRITKMCCELQGSVHILVNSGSGWWSARHICQRHWGLWDDGRWLSSTKSAWNGRIFLGIAPAFLTNPF